MKRGYSRLTRTEERKNQRSVFVFSALTVALIIFIIFFGLPLTVRVSNFFAEITGRSPVFEINDNTPPAPPSLDSLPKYTSEKRITIKGSAEEGSSVILTINADKEELVTDVDGDFSHTYSLRQEKNTISAVAVDRSGNNSKRTATLTVIYDTEAPEITIISPQNGDSFFGQDNKLSIEGEVEEKTQVTINDRVVVVSGIGKFMHLIPLQDGKNAFNIIATDLAGNETEMSLSVNYSL